MMQQTEELQNHKLTTHRTKRVWLSQCLALVIGISLSLSIAIHFYKTQINQSQNAFIELTQKDMLFLQNRLNRHSEILNTIGSFFLSSSDVTHSEFSSFIKPYLQTSQGFDTIGWINTSNTGTPYRITHIEPNEQSRVLSLNATDDNNLHPMIRQTIAKQKTTFFIDTLLNTDLTDLHHEQSDLAFHMFIFAPVYEDNSTGDSQLRGISFSVIDVEKAIQFAFRTAATEKKLRYSVYKKYKNNSPVLIYQDKKLADDTPFHHSEILDLGTADIIIDFHPSDAFLRQTRPNQAYILFIILSVLTLTTIFARQMATNIATLKMASQKTQAANQLQSDFLATMSHEIRTPMNGILGMAELILDARPTQQIEGYVRTIMNSSESLMNIIDDILDFSKIEAGRMELDPMACDLLEICDDVAQLYSVRARDKAIELAVRYTPGTEQFVYADPLRLRQILGNLITNAIKFTAHGHVVLTIENDPNLPSEDDTIHIKFSITDTGIGMNADAQKLIFQRFKQADTSTTRKYGGTGLGLSICKSLVELMSGTITVESVENKGSTFSFTLPLKRNYEEANEIIKSPLLKGLRVLYVDDLPVMRQILEEQLEHAEIRIDTAQSGEQALIMMEKACAENDDYKIVIIDYLMPDMNGEMLARAINDEEQLRKACLIMLTAAGNPMANEEFAGKGFSSYLAKPINNRTLIENLNFIWKKYNEGHTEELISVDRKFTQNNNDDEDQLILPDSSVLIAEDNLVNQIFIKEILEEMQIHYTIVSNGQEALDATKEHSYDLILMDCLMPVLDGYQATEAIRKASRHMAAHIPIVALTANAMKGDREKCLEAGMDDYLTKPIRKKELKEIVHKWITGTTTGDKHMPNNETQGGEKNNIVSLRSGNDNTAAIANSNAQEETDQTVNLSEFLDKELVNTARNILKNKYDEMVDVYIHDSWNYAEEIKVALKNKDITELIRPAHTLKSSSKQMGAVILSEIAKEIEHLARTVTNEEQIQSYELDEALNNMKRLFSELEAALANTKEALKNIAA